MTSLLKQMVHGAHWGLFGYNGLDKFTFYLSTYILTYLLNLTHLREGITHYEGLTCIPA